MLVPMLLIHNLLMEWNVYSNMNILHNLLAIFAHLLILCFFLCVYLDFVQLKKSKNQFYVVYESFIVSRVWEFYCDHVKTLPGKFVEENLWTSKICTILRLSLIKGGDFRELFVCVYLQYVLFYWCGTNNILPVNGWTRLYQIVGVSMLLLC